MRIAFIVRQFHRRGGIARYVAELAEAYSKRHEVHVYSSSLDLMSDSNVVCHKVPMASFGFLRQRKKYAWNNVFEVATFMKNSRRVFSPKGFDVVHSQGDFSDDCDVYTAHSCHKAWLNIAQNRNRGVFEKLKKSGLNPLHYYVLKAENTSVYRSKRIISVSNVIKKEILDNYDVDANKIVTIPNGVDINKFAPENRHEYKAKVRKKYGINDDAIVSIFPAHEFKRKGLGQLLDAMRLLNMPRLRLLVVGRDDGAPYRNVISKYCLENDVIFAGESENIEEYFAASDMMVLPTTYEPFGLVVAEAMASGLPVVVSRCAGVSELISDGEDGILLNDRDDVNEISNHLRSLVLNKELRETVGAKARKKAGQYSWQKIAEMTMALYNDVVREKSA